jgi:hypothetical protein
VSVAIGGDRYRRAGAPGHHGAIQTGSFIFAPTAIHDYLAAFWTPEARSALHRVNQLLRE